MLDKETKRKFYDSSNKLVHEIPPTDKVFIGEDLNGHVSNDKKGYEIVYGGQFENKNDTKELL